MRILKVVGVVVVLFLFNTAFAVHSASAGGSTLETLMEINQGLTAVQNLNQAAYAAKDLKGQAMGGCNMAPCGYMNLPTLTGNLLILLSPVLVAIALKRREQ